MVDSTNEVEKMRWSFSGHEGSISAAVQIYSQPDRVFYEHDDIYNDDLREVLSVLKLYNRIHVKIDPDVLSVLARKFQNLCRYTLRFVGFIIESSGSVFLRQASDFEDRYKKYFTTVHPPLAKLLTTHGYIKYLRAFNNHLGLSTDYGQPNYEESDEVYYSSFLVPPSNRIAVAVKKITDEDTIVFGLQKAIYDHSIHTLTRLLGVLTNARVPVDPREVESIRNNVRRLLDLDATKREAHFNKLTILQREGNSPMVNRALAMVTEHRDAVSTMVVEVNGMLSKVTSMRNELTSVVLNTPPEPVRVHPNRPSRDGH